MRAIVCLLLAACAVEPEPIVPMGEHHRFVVTSVDLPNNSAEARAIGFDVDGHAAVDNQWGMVAGTLESHGIRLQALTNEAVDAGRAPIVLDIQTTSFEASEGVGITVNDSPVVLLGRFDEHGLLETERDASAAIEIPVPAMDGTYAVALPRVRLAMVDGVLTGAIAGAFDRAELDEKAMPFIAGMANVGIARDCSKLDQPNVTPRCGCTDLSLGKDLESLFDTDPIDCAVTTEEVTHNGLVQSLLAPDVRIDGIWKLSFGFAVSFAPMP